jgi:hypothetical protein
MSYKSLALIHPVLSPVLQQLTWNLCLRIRITAALVRVLELLQGLRLVGFAPGPDGAIPIIPTVLIGLDSGLLFLEEFVAVGVHGEALGADMAHAATGVVVEVLLTGHCC